MTLQSAIARYGALTKAKLHNIAATGEPEDQLRAPLEGLCDDLSELCGFPRGAVKAIGQVNAPKLRVLVGGGYIENVTPEEWNYEGSGKHVLTQWFSYHKRNREKPPMGDKRPPSELCKIQPESWPAEYTTELLHVIHVLGRLVELQGRQADLLERICSGVTISESELKANDALIVPRDWRKKLSADTGGAQRLLSAEAEEA